MSIGGKSSPVAEGARDRASRIPSTGNATADEFHAIVAGLQNEFDLTFGEAWNRARNENRAKWDAYCESIADEESEAKTGKKKSNLQKREEADKKMWAGPPPKPMHSLPCHSHKDK